MTATNHTNLGFNGFLKPLTCTRLYILEVVDKIGVGLWAFFMLLFLPFIRYFSLYFTLLYFSFFSFLFFFRATLKGETQWKLNKDCLCISYCWAILANSKLQVDETLITIAWGRGETPPLSLSSHIFYVFFLWVNNTFFLSQMHLSFRIHTSMSPLNLKPSLITQSS